MVKKQESFATLGAAQRFNLNTASSRPQRTVLVSEARKLDRFRLNTYVRLYTQIARGSSGTVGAAMSS
jgi:hypothetical protein